MCKQETQGSLYYFFIGKSILQITLNVNFFFLFVENSLGMYPTLSKPTVGKQIYIKDKSRGTHFTEVFPAV